MRDNRISFPEVALIAATRGMLGVGIGLLAAERLRTNTRHTVGWTLFAIGALSTIPIVVRQVMHQRKQRDHEPSGPRTVAGG
jgi:hypothetical protein